ncbi:immunoglobulin kappa light chain isoform X2 [Cuculus canorus]|uniref:immunoglobulin kappa light chain isoform X2 n=1 Tax=Cuculus canorus TaxID=55661 RepID=UPI0023AB19F1|nr:immunoglobulin kappa light chain isoform X2 [Cuculus canorus]
MWLLSTFILVAGVSCGSAQVLQQSPISITKPERKTVLINCHVSNPDFNNIFIHWYQKRPNAALKRIAYISTRLFLEEKSDEGKFSVEKDLTKSVCTLTVSKVTLQDSATYYCATWDADVKIFGSGTKLIVSDKRNSLPASSEILQKKHKNTITYVCLIEKFYPEVIRVTWSDGKKEITENVVKGDAWKPEKEDKYSIGSWLTVPAKNKDKIYYCNYEHESGQNLLHTEGPSQKEDCSMYLKNGTTFNRDHILHRTAYLVYIVLLLKSSMYYLIVLFFIYRVWASTKQQGKKA